MISERINFKTFDNTGCPFPVNALFLTFASVNPNTYWPGTTWQQIECGRFIVASAGRTEGGTGDASPNNNNSTWYPINEKGGARTVKLTAAQSGHPKLTHSITQPVFKMVNHAHTNTHGHTQNAHNHGVVITGSNQVAGSGFQYIYSSSKTMQNYYGANDMVKNATPTINNYTGNTGNPTSLGDLNRSTNVGVGDHAAADASSTHENRPPYIAVAMWKRTA